ncbi:MAG: NAD(P)/FAD-dependent oxidoreductase [Panacagrimonas sp.]
MNAETAPAHFDAIVIGGSYAGLSAAPQLARARRRVLVIDAGLRRNRFATSSHGFLGRDGHPAEAIAEDGRAQLLAYPSVQWLEATAAHAEPVGDGFAIEEASGRRFKARRLVLATGVTDELPDLEGLAQRWGKSVFHCPYCHGYELDEGHIGVLAVGSVSLHHALMLPDWGRVTFFTNDAFVPDEAQRSALQARGVTIEPVRAARMIETATIELIDGRHVDLAGLFVASRTRMASPIAERLGCAFEEGPLGSYIRTDDVKATSIPGVFACGDAARMASSVAFAVGDGMQAGTAAHRSLIFP